MTLTDQDASMMNALGETELEDLSLKPALQEILDLQRKHVIETHARLIEHTDSNKATNKCVTLEKALRVFVVEF